MDLSKFYYVVAEREQSFDKFMIFMRFMFDNYKLIYTIKEESDREAFEYHFHKIPEYVFNMFSKLEYSIAKEVAIADLAIMNIGKKIQEYGQGEEL